MKKDIILAGVGGQGILTIATIIGYAVVSEKLNLKQAEVHGMSQRGGDVQSHLRISDKEIFSDLIPHSKADLILSLEPMESLRYLPFLKKDGWLITNSKPFINIPNYPDHGKLMAEIKSLPNQMCLNAEEIAKKSGSLRAANMVVLGAAAKFLDLPFEKLEEGIRTIFSRKGEKVVETNLKALSAGNSLNK